tara:strand:+ start:1767 stop:2891 length:1125 start_codon:yes stop_codon:yes gene_type:complete
MVFSNNFLSGMLGNKFGSMFNGRQSLQTNSLPDPFSTDPTIQGNFPKKQILKYPLDLGGTPQLGHYIVFKINTQDAGKLKYDETSKPTVNTISSENDEQSSSRRRADPFGGQGNTGGYGSTSGGGMVGNKTKQLEQNAQAKKEQRAKFTFTRAPTSEINTMIALYMPATVEVNYASAYEDQNVGIIGQQVDKLGNEGVDSVMNRQNMTNLAKEAEIGAKGLVGAKGIQFAREGKIVTDRMELIFSGVSKREFSYSFKFLPKSLDEAKEIREIINRFKFHMLPELEGDPGTSRRFVTPDTFNIEYQWVGGGGKNNTYLNKIATCVLKNMSVKYGGGRYSAHVDDGEGSTPPVESEMTLQFQELEIITKTLAKQGF